MTEARSWGEATGATIREHRTACNATLDALASQVTELGFRTSVSGLSDIEKGRVTASVPLLIGIAAALGSLRGTPMTLSELIPPEGTITLGENASIDAAGLRLVFEGEPVSPMEVEEFDLEPMKIRMERLRPDMPSGLRGERLERLLKHTPNLVERRAAKTLGVDPFIVTAHAIDAWNMPLSVKRDTDAPADASPQARGYLLRALVDEIRQRIEWRRAHPSTPSTTSRTPDGVLSIRPGDPGEPYPGNDG